MCRLKAFVVAHSKAYTVAMLVCWAEFWLEWLLLGGRKYSAVVFWTGTAIAIGGQVLHLPMPCMHTLSLICAYVVVLSVRPSA